MVRKTNTALTETASDPRQNLPGLLLRTMISLPFPFASALYDPSDRGTQIRFDPCAPQLFELVCEDGLAIWGEAWGGSGEPIFIEGPAEARFVSVKGMPHIEIRRESRREMLIPAVQVMSIAPRSSAAASVEIVAGSRDERVFH